MKVFRNRQYSKSNNHIKINGERYCLRHLKPLEIMVTLRGETEVKMVFFFSTHTFTEGEDSSVFRSIDYMIRDETNSNPDSHHERVFDIARYRDSLMLPVILSNITEYTELIYNRKNRSFLVEDEDYHIILNIYRKIDGSEVMCYVRTAYRKDNIMGGNKKELGEYIKDLGF